MKSIIIFFLIGLIISCSPVVNPTNYTTSIKGVWVESTLRLDTLNFDFYFPDSLHNYCNLKSKPLIAATTTFYTNPNFIAQYYFNKDSICLYMMHSNCNVFIPYKFQLANDSLSFNIGKFYVRQGIDSSKPVMKFDRIK